MDYDGFYADTLRYNLIYSYIFALSNALAALIISIKASIVSIKAAIASSFVPLICIAAMGMSIGLIIYAIRRLAKLSIAASKTRSVVKSIARRGGINPRKLNNNTVYVIVRKGTTDVVYVGRTKNFYARRATHQRTRFPKSRYTMYAIMTGLPLAESRALEQAIITAYGLDTLMNMINSISPKKWHIFKTEFEQMQTLIESYFDPQ